MRSNTQYLSPIVYIRRGSLARARESFSIQFRDSCKLRVLEGEAGQFPGRVPGDISEAQQSGDYGGGIVKADIPFTQLPETTFAGSSEESFLPMMRLCTLNM